MCGWESAWDTLTPANTADCARERRRRQKKVAATAMRIAATPPTAVPAMAAVFELRPPGVGDTVEDALEEDVGATDVETSVGLRIEPGPSSGVSIQKHGVRR